MRRSLARAGKPVSRPAPDSRMLPPADARQVDREEAIAAAPVPDLSEADLRAGVEAAASLGARIDVEATHADWRQYVAAMDVPLYSPVSHWITFCRRRARQRSSSAGSAAASEDSRTEPQAQTFERD